MLVKWNRISSKCIWFIFLLISNNLENDCYYVGTTSFSSADRQEYIESINKPIEIMKYINCSDDIKPGLQEDMHAKQLMSEHRIAKI